MILLISASQVARIIGVSHQHPADSALLTEKKKKNFPYLDSLKIPFLELYTMFVNHNLLNISHFPYLLGIKLRASSLLGKPSTT
jgi:hypothetical protein